ncbi:MAG: CDP-alcohol phosphatidyltransferase family protein [Acidimicrobiales bacterium]
MGTSELALDGLWTVPNALSLVRLGCVPLFLWLLVGAGDTVAAASLLAFLGATDWVDGWFARRFGQVSTVGKVLDPTADRALLAAGVIGAVVVGAVPLWLFAVVVAREVLVSAAVLGLAASGSARIDVIWVGKAGAFALMFALPLFLFGHSWLPWRQIPEDLAWAFVAPGLACSWWAAGSYVPHARRALARGRSGRRAGPDGAGGPDGSVGAGGSVGSVG